MPVRDQLGTVAIAPAHYVPDSNFDTFAKGAGSGAVKGAAILGGTTAAVTAGAAAAVAPMMAPVIVFAGILTTAAMTATGAVAGAEQAVSAATAHEVEAAIDTAVAGLDAHNKLAAQLAAAIDNEPWIHLAAVDATGPANPAAHPRYAQLQTLGIDSVIEVAITEIGFESCGPEFVRRISSACPEDSERPMIDLFLSASVRLVRVADDAELFARRFRYKSALREIPRWVADDGKLLAEEFDYAYRELAERVRDEVLLVSPLPLPAPTTFGQFPGPDNPGYGICWLAPVYPAATPVTVPEVLRTPFDKPTDACPASGLHFSKVDSLRPTLRWDAFPRTLDRRTLDPAVLQQITDVTYELKLWEVENCERGRLVYARTALAAPEHRLETLLLPASRYFWSVRARFTQGGQPSATRWAHFDPTTCFPNDIADWQYHRFVTPR